MKLEEVLEHYRSGYNLAYILGITPQAVSDWQKMSEIPVKHQYRIERITNGKFKCVDPDLKKIKQRANDYEKKCAAQSSKF